MHNVSLITVNFNNTAVTAELLQSLAALQLTNLQVIVVDNGSRYDPGELLKGMFPWITFIRSHHNLGFAGGNNLGIAAATGDYLFLVNNDTVFKQNIIPHMVALLEQHHHVGVLCPVIHYHQAPDVVQYAGYTPINKVTGRNQCITAVDNADGNGMVYTSYAHGAAMLIPTRVVRTVGNMPENYFLYYEELDWCEKIRRAGYEIAVDTRSVIYHKESQTVDAISELKSYFLCRNRILFMRRNARTLHRLAFWLYFVAVATPVQLLRYVVQRRWVNISAHLAGIQWNLYSGKESQRIGYKFNYLNSHD